jgi:hypothetical protein
MDVWTGSLSNAWLKDEETIVRPRKYAWYHSVDCPEWVKGLLPRPVENGFIYPGIGADCVKPLLRIDGRFDGWIKVRQAMFGVDG